MLKSVSHIFVEELKKKHATYFVILAISMVNSKNKHIENIMFFHGALDTYAFKMGIGLLVSSYEDIIIIKC